MRPITTVVPRSVVCMFVCLCVAHTDELCKHGRNGRNTLWGRLCWTQGTNDHVIDEVQDPPGEWEIFGVVRAIEKHWESLLWCTQKRLNRSRCRLGADSCEPKEPCVRRRQWRTNPFAATRGDRSVILAHGWGVQKVQGWYMVSWAPMGKPYSPRTTNHL